MATGLATASATSFMTGSGIGAPLQQTFGASSCAISLSAPTPISGSVTVLFDQFSISTGQWTPSAIASALVSAINSGVNVQASAITGSVDGLRPNVTGVFTGVIKIFIGVYSGGSPPT